MKQVLKNFLQLSPVLTAVACIAANPVLAAENQHLTTVTELSDEENSMAQVTSVSQFSDVQPTDWAFRALQSLVERYGCIAGYPNGTYGGNRAMTIGSYVRSIDCNGKSCRQNIFAGICIAVNVFF